MVWFRIAVLICVTLVLYTFASGGAKRRVRDVESAWLFDQAQNVAALTTRQVLEENAPILTIIHYEDDHSWAFLCGTTDDDTDGRVISMKQVVEIDSSVLAASGLPIGWSANRSSVEEDWVLAESEK